MYGISLDDDPDAPVGTPATRRAVAIHWNWTTKYTTEEIASALGVTPQTVRRYVTEGPGEEVRNVIKDVEAEVRLIAVQELKEQLRVAGDRARSAEKPVKIYETGDGVEVKDITNDEGEVIKRVPVVQDYQLLPDEEARYYARSEAREILDQLADLVGAGEPEQVEVEGSGIVIRTEADDGHDD